MSYTTLTQIGLCLKSAYAYAYVDHSHDLMGGQLHVYKRENSRFWQCSAFLNGRNHRVSTKQESLAHAKDFAEDWFLELKGKIRRGEAPGGGVTFDKAADQFLREFVALTAGERSPIYVTGHQDRLRVHLRPFFGKKGLTKSPPASCRSTASTG